MPGETKQSHDFKEKLLQSEKDSGLIDPFLLEFFPKNSTITYVTSQWKQKSGVDKIVITPEGKSFSIDEKIREFDYGDICLETLSDVKRNKLGWATEIKDTDFIAYYIKPSNVCYFIQQRTLVKTVWTKVEKWRKVGYFEGFTSSNGGKWHTKFICIPVDRLYKDMADVSRIAM